MNRYDVCIVGGGLAGLSLAIHLKRDMPDLNILVLERRKHPAPEAAFKIGEATVEVGAHYFSDRLGLRQHIENNQLLKLGARFFFNSGDNQDISQRVEFGASHFPPTPSFQLDRGRLENYMVEEIRRLGVEFLPQSRTGEIRLDSSHGHQVTWRDHSRKSQTIVSRWVIDASGRAGILKRLNQLQKPVRHKANAVWFRIEQRIKIDDWCTNDIWRERTSPNFDKRWLSTNHLMGSGYWVWLIPLSSGATSVGIVCDADQHDFESMKSFQKALEWLDNHEPQCAHVIHQCQNKLQDFCGYRDYSYGCKQVFSADRWCLTGEAGVFVDPFYSPGSDYIAFSNTYIAELINRDHNGLPFQSMASLFNRIYMQFFDRQMALYDGQYEIFGNPRIMSLKILWDFTYYWSIPAFIFFHRRLCDLQMFATLESSLSEADQLNREMQSIFRKWNRFDNLPQQNQFVNISQIPFMIKLNRQLEEPIPDPAFTPRLEENIQDMIRVAAEIKAMGCNYFATPEHSPSPDVSSNWFADTGKLLFG